MLFLAGVMVGWALTSPSPSLQHTPVRGFASSTAILRAASSLLPLTPQMARMNGRSQQMGARCPRLHFRSHVTTFKGRGLDTSRTLHIVYEVFHRLKIVELNGAREVTDTISSFCG